MARGWKEVPYRCTKSSRFVANRERNGDWLSKKPDFAPLADFYAPFKSPDARQYGNHLQLRTRSTQIP